MKISDFYEACKINEINVVEPSDDPDQPYKLCNQCYKRLLKYSLRPVEWYNLAKFASFSGSSSPSAIALSISRAETPKTSETTEPNLMFAPSNTYWIRC